MTPDVYHLRARWYLEWYCIHMWRGRQNCTLSPRDKVYNDIIYLCVVDVYFDVNRYLNILHTRIRNNCSALHNDLFHANLIHSPSCSCGYSTENAEHFLLYCKRFDAQRNLLYRSLLAANVHIDLNTLLFGSKIYNIDTNRHVFITVQTYIKETCRFSFRWLSWM